MFRYVWICLDSACMFYRTLAWGILMASVRLCGSTACCRGESSQGRFSRGVWSSLRRCKCHWLFFFYLFANMNAFFDWCFIHFIPIHSWTTIHEYWPLTKTWIVLFPLRRPRHSWSWRSEMVPSPVKDSRKKDLCWWELEWLESLHCPDCTFDVVDLQICGFP